MARKQTLLVDFDGVLASYNGWQGPDVLGEPLPNARHAILLLVRDYTVVVFTTRDPQHISPWLSRHGFPALRVTNKKDPAFLQIDDRALCFQGAWTNEFLTQIRAFAPWWQRPQGPQAVENSQQLESPQSAASAATD